jgi:hypothetical protein
MAARKKWVECIADYGTDWWVDDVPIRDFETTEFPAWIGKE